MRPLAYVLIVVIPLVALATVVLAAVPHRPGRLHDVTTPDLKTRLTDLDVRRRAGVAGLDRERRRLRAELLRRGHGREPGSSV